ncbi:putative ribosomal protein L1 [Blattamonas nauphoetae]|uniref:Ribosomal protein L1 n=1 Tax=Blattamonas nauphoetae TaxID=2049346 RepID=A0ABQ9YJC5_9EUKA|nr:putative ribosomal protein L1 [Blattamonas nauphoetae]
MTVTRSQLHKTAGELLAFARRQAEETVSFDHPIKSVDLNYVLNRVPPKALVAPRLITLPNNPYKPNLKVFLIVKDGVKEAVQQMELPLISQIMTLTETKNNYKAYKDRRLLCSQYDMFLADDRVIPTLPRVLGSVFVKRNKVPIPVKIKSKEATTRSVHTVLNSAHVRTPGGAVGSIQVGTTQLSQDELTDNLWAAYQYLISNQGTIWKIDAPLLKTEEDPDDEDEMKERMKLRKRNYDIGLKSVYVRCGNSPSIQLFKKQD